DERRLKRDQHQHASPQGQYEDDDARKPCDEGPDHDGDAGCADDTPDPHPRLDVAEVVHDLPKHRDRRYVDRDYAVKLPSREQHHRLPSSALARFTLTFSCAPHTHTTAVAGLTDVLDPRVNHLAAGALSRVANSGTLGECSRSTPPTRDGEESAAVANGEHHVNVPPRVILRLGLIGAFAGVGVVVMALLAAWVTFFWSAYWD